MFERLHEKLKDTHSHVVVLLSTLLKPDELPEFVATDRRRSAYLCAMEMIINIQAYVSHARNNFAAKCIFQKLKSGKIYCPLTILRREHYRRRVSGQVVQILQQGRAFMAVDSREYHPE